MRLVITVSVLAIAIQYMPPVQDVGDGVVGLGGGNGDCRLVDVDPEQVGSSAANLLEGDQSLALSSSDNVAKVTLTEAWRNGGQSGDVHGSKYI